MTKRAFTLIELVFTIVIIAVVFTVIPKIIFAFNKSDSFSVHEDALFNGVSLVQMASRLPWDENDTNYNDILHSKGDSRFDCSEIDYYRIGGFVGSRNCEHNLSASYISSEGVSNSNYFNDFDDFNDYNVTATQNGAKIYLLSNKVSYIEDNISVISYQDNSAKINLNNAKEVNNTTTNLKRLKTDIYYVGKRGKIRKLSYFSYVSANIGQIFIKKRSW